MPNIKFFLFIICVITATGCQNPETNAKADSENTMSQDSGKNVKKAVADFIPDDSMTSEVTVRDTRMLRRDTVTIMYHRIIDSLFGYLSGDTLIVEGDILIKYPRLGVRGVATTFNLWPKRANNTLEIAYKIDPEVPKQSRVTEALDMWRTVSNRKIEFVEKRFDYQKDFIAFVSSENTQSYIGVQGNRQTIEVSAKARKGNIAHEIGHALGLYHEQSRKDRDSFIIVTCPGDINYVHAFQDDPFAHDISGYNYASIMHYPVSPINSCLRIRPDKNPSVIPGQRDSVTIGDYNTIRAIYKLN